MLCKYREQSQKEKNSRACWVRMVIHLEMCVTLIFEHYKLYVHKPEYLPETEMENIFWNFK